MFLSSSELKLNRTLNPTVFPKMSHGGHQVLVYKQSTKTTIAAFQVVSTLGWGQLDP